MSLIQYTSIPQPSSLEIPKIKGSRFIGHVIPIKDAKEAMQVVKDFQKKFFDATHNCWAYRCGVKLHYDLFDQAHIDSLEKRDSDDGEPAGTAGKPILKVIEGMDIHNILVIVTRYFGGTMLGAGGLVQAYTDATKAVLEAAEKQFIGIQDTLQLIFDYSDTAKVMYLVDKYATTIAHQQCDAKTLMQLTINKGQTHAFLSDCKETGKIAVKLL